MSDNLREWLRAEGVQEDAEALALKGAISEQLLSAMKDGGLSKTEVARRMHTSRAALERLLDPSNASVTLSTLEKAAKAVGCSLRLELLSTWLRKESNERSPAVLPVVIIDERIVVRQEGRLRRQRAGSAIFEATAAQVSRLDERQLTELLRRLVAAELDSVGLPARDGQVTSNINLPDGGEDGCADWIGGPNDTDFLPSRFCLFQCKVRDRGPAMLRRETQRPGKAKPELREALALLLDRRGSYIVATTSELTPHAKRDRQAAIRAGIEEAGGKPDLLATIEIYDATSLAEWASLHPRVALWINETLRHVSLGGFQTHARWGAAPEIAGTYVDDGQPRFRLHAVGGIPGYDAAQHAKNMNFEALLRAATSFLGSPQKSIRIVGPSGFGKTRLAFELFSSSDTSRLDAGSVVFAVYGDVRDRLGALALELAESGAATTLVVDECPEHVHLDLLRKARRQGSRLRVVTIDIETRTHQAANNLVVELGPASTDLIEQVARNTAADISASDIQFVRELAQGFPRMAILAADAIGGGRNAVETIDELVERILWGGSAPDEQGATALEMASLFTFVGAEHHAAEELALLGEEVQLSRNQMFTHLMRFKARGIVAQSGDFLEVKPLPLAARLAARRLSLMPRDWLATLFLKLSQPMQLRLLGRLRWLDKVPEAQHFARHILGSKLSTLDVLNSEHGSQLLERLVHVDPDRAMTMLSGTLGSLDERALVEFKPGRRGAVWALQRLVFRAASFVPAAVLLRRLGATAQDDDSTHAASVFKGLFQLYLSGTEAEPADRLEVLDEGLESKSPRERALCVDALEKMLDRAHFTRDGGHEQIGSDAPLVDWQPELWRDVFSFHLEGLRRLCKIACSQDTLSERARNHIASNIRGLLSLPNLFEDVEATVYEIVQSVGFWPEGIRAVNSWLYFDRVRAPADYAERVRQVYSELLPQDLVEQVVFYTSGWKTDLHDPDRVYSKAGEHDFEYAQREALKLAPSVIANDQLRRRVITRVTRGRLNGIFPFAHRLGELAQEPVTLMREALGLIEGETDAIEYRFFTGLLSGVDAVSHETGLQCLKLALASAELRRGAVSLIGSVKSDSDVLDLAMGLLTRGEVAPRDLVSLSYGRGLDHLSPNELEPFIEALMGRNPDGAWAALEVLSMYQHGREGLSEKVASWLQRILVDPSLYACASNEIESHNFEETARLLHRHGYLGADYAGSFTSQLLRLASVPDFEVQLKLDDAARTILALLIAEHPEQVWQRVQESLGSQEEPLRSYRLSDLLQLESRAAADAGLLFSVPREVYLGWLSAAPEARLNFVLGWVPITRRTESGSLSWHPDFKKLLDDYTVQPSDLKTIFRRLYPRSWWGSLADQLEPYAALLREWSNHPNAVVRAWVAESITRLENEIELERRRDGNREVEYRS